MNGVSDFIAISWRARPLSYVVYFTWTCLELFVAFLLMLNGCKGICMKQLTLLYFSWPYFPILLGYEFSTGLPGQDTYQVSPMKQWNNGHYCIFPILIRYSFLIGLPGQVPKQVAPMGYSGGVHPAIAVTGIEWVRWSSALAPTQTTYFYPGNNGSSRTIVYHLILNPHSIY